MKHITKLVVFFEYTLDKCKEKISEPEYILLSLLQRKMLFLVLGIVMNWIKKRNIHLCN